MICPKCQKNTPDDILFCECCGCRLEDKDDTIKNQDKTNQNEGIERLDETQNIKKQKLADSETIRSSSSDSKTSGSVILKCVSVFALTVLAVCMLKPGKSFITIFPGAIVFFIVYHAEDNRSPLFVSMGIGIILGFFIAHSI